MTWRSYLYKSIVWDFPGGSMVKTSPCNAEGVGSVPGQGTNKILQAVQQGQKEKKGKKKMLISYL